MLFCNDADMMKVPHLSCLFINIFLIYASILYCRQNNALFYHLCIIFSIHFGELDYFD